MSHRFSVLLAGAALTLAGVAAATPATAAPSLDPTPAPTLTCPPALPISGRATAVTTTSVTISYSMILTPPCGYNPPVTVTLFASQADAQQWLNPVAEAVSGPERNGQVTLDGLAPGTEYWLRFSADGKHDPYLFPSVRTAAVPVCAATAQIGSTWSGGFVATVTVRNVAAEALTGWRVSWRWAGDERIQTMWNAVPLDSTTGVTVGNASYNATLPPGGSTTFGMLVATSTPTGDLTLTCDR
ncbi:cellulase/cellobiase CelA1 [Actinoplanes tereljensis]|uniref:CBM2 domain-containing protein n=1 Tax=Paractinoplanes tereljensis TaxID=571912 RepID=A0A919NUI2_9ACTN|nr:cellulose binding domain-containing protein [Actinoplanes tereljensis]GIF23742.1 hypothetical protein Ate02nite_64720 [Actinoplanes tereljensis]